MDRNDCNITFIIVEDSDTDDELEYDFDLEEGIKLIEFFEERVDEESDLFKFLVIDIDKLYVRLSEEYVNIKKIK